MMRSLLLVVAVLLFVSAPVRADNYFLKITADGTALSLQSSVGDPGGGDVNITLLTVSQLPPDGHGVQRITDADLWRDDSLGIYQLWAVVRNDGGYSHCSTYYAWSPSLFSWDLQDVQECYWTTSPDPYGLSNQNDITVLKTNGGQYLMWYAIYQVSGWRTQIWHRTSADGIAWSAPTLVLPAGNLEDWNMPTVVNMTSGPYRIYLSHQQTDSPPPFYTFSGDADPTTGVVSNLSQITTFEELMVGAYPVGNRYGSAEHLRYVRRFLAMAWHLIELRSVDEGQTWTEQDLGLYSSTNYAMVGVIESDPPATPTPAPVPSSSTGGLALLVVLFTMFTVLRGKR